jgi:hypothetical protein
VCVCVFIDQATKRQDLGSINTSFEDPHKSFLINLGETGLFHFPSGTLYSGGLGKFRSHHSSLVTLDTLLVFVHRNKGSKIIHPGLRVSPHPTSFLLNSSRCHPSTLHIRISSLLRTYDIHPMLRKLRSDALLAALAPEPVLVHPSE